MRRVRHAMRLIGTAALLALHTPVAAAGQAGSPSADLFTFDEKEVLRTSQAALGRTPTDRIFIDARGREVRLSDFRGKPLIVNLIYTSCYHTCPTIVERLARAVSVARDAVGSDSFNVVSLGFDGRNDTPARMRAFAREHGIALENWRFLSADQNTIDAFTRDVGFRFYPSPRGFDHLAQTTMLDASGAVYRQIYGSSFTPPFVVEPLKELVFGLPASLTSVSGVLNKIRLFCTIYDPSTDAYRFDYSVVIGAAIGLLSLGATGFILFRAWRRARWHHTGA